MKKPKIPVFKSPETAASYESAMRSYRRFKQLNKLHKGKLKKLTPV